MAAYATTCICVAQNVLKQVPVWNLLYIVEMEFRAVVVDNRICAIPVAKSSEMRKYALVLMCVDRVHRLTLYKSCETPGKSMSLFRPVAPTTGANVLNIPS